MPLNGRDIHVSNEAIAIRSAISEGCRSLSLTMDGLCWTIFETAAKSREVYV
jgi:hypothetical protein